MVMTGMPTSVMVDSFHVRRIMNTKEPMKVTKFLEVGK